MGLQETLKKQENVPTCKVTEDTDELKNQIESKEFDESDKKGTQSRKKKR